VSEKESEGAQQHTREAHWWRCNIQRPRGVTRATGPYGQTGTATQSHSKLEEHSDKDQGLCPRFRHHHQAPVVLKRYLLEIVPELTD
jgi:hypothetical protein